MLSSSFPSVKQIFGQGTCLCKNNLLSRLILRRSIGSKDCWRDVEVISMLNIVLRSKLDTYVH